MSKTTTNIVEYIKKSPKLIAHPQQFVLALKVSFLVNRGLFRLDIEESAPDSVALDY